MNKIEFISHEFFPDDEYVKELVYLCLEGKYRVAYVRKKAQKGGLFWGVGMIGVKSGSEKHYFPAFMQDSVFLEKDIKTFLENRSWEKNKSVFSEAPAAKVESSGFSPNDDGLPF
jgi:hypothetical protein